MAGFGTGQFRDRNGLPIFDLKNKIMKLSVTHFLHIGKTGGSAIKAALQPLAVAYGLKLHEHKIILRDIPDTENVIFVVRDPITRFVSAFNSRLRQGRPRYDVPWREGERIAFERFRTPNKLAEALSSNVLGERQAAVAAMQQIQHLQSPLTDWLEGEAYLQSRRSQILYFGFQETLGEDFEQIKKRLGLPAETALPTDPVAAHVTPADYSAELSESGAKNIAEWYAEDVRLYAFLYRLRHTLSTGRVPVHGWIGGEA